MTCAVGIWLGGCVENPQPVSTGIATGRVVDSDSSGVHGATVLIEGTNFLAGTDTLGNYTLYGLPGGKHQLRVGMYWLSYEDLAEIEVVPGETTSVPDYVYIPWRPYDTRNLHLFTTEDSLLADLLQSSVRESKRAFVKWDSVYLSFALYENKKLPNHNASRAYPVKDTVRVFANGKAVFSDIPRKGRVKTGPFRLTGSDTLQVTVGRDTLHTYRVLDPGDMQGNYLRIRIGETHLKERDSIPSDHRWLYWYGVPTHFARVGSLLFEVFYADSEEIDWDILLVNDSRGDTCWWSDPFPDWGAAGKSEDDPSFSGDEYSSHFPKGLKPDNIEAYGLGSGTYTVLVKMYESSSSPDTAAVPQVNIELGKPGDMPLLAHYLKASPGRGMKVGETWMAGRIRLPEMTFDVSEQKIFAAGKARRVQKDRQP